MRIQYLLMITKEDNKLPVSSSRLYRSSCDRSIVTLGIDELNITPKQQHLCLLFGPHEILSKACGLKYDTKLQENGFYLVVSRYKVYS
jgi:hypothetical protein